MAKIRRMHFRDGISLREVAKRTGLSRNTIRRWLRRPDTTEPQYPARKSPSKIDAWAELLETWLKTGSHRVKRERRTTTAMFEALRAQGYDGVLILNCQKPSAQQASNRVDWCSRLLKMTACNVPTCQKVWIRV
jgi:transcriptional regulator with XRE-family HTH domain